MLSSFEEAFYHKSITSQLHKLRFVHDHTASTRIFDGLPVNLKDKIQNNSNHLSYVLIGLGFTDVIHGQLSAVFATINSLFA